jgi:hypothetical protein
MDEVVVERIAQDERWGGPARDDLHGSYDWVAYLVHDLGKAIAWPWDAGTFRRQMISVAALAIAAVEWVDRGDARDAPEVVDPTSGEGNLGDPS